MAADFISIKQSLAAWNLWNGDLYEKFRLIKHYLEIEKKATFKFFRKDVRQNRVA
jgi:hypothetical protein